MKKQKKQERCPLCEQTIKACDKTIENLHKHYRYIMKNLSPIEKISLSYGDDNDMHFVSFITVDYVRKGMYLEKTKRYAPGHTFSKSELVRDFNELLAEILSNKVKRLEE